MDKWRDLVNAVIKLQVRKKNNIKVDLGETGFEDMDYCV
jgi:hypothetical protein